jgi:hypothetical protein
MSTQIRASSFRGVVVGAGKHIPTGRAVARKTMPLTSGSLERIKSELRIWDTLRHINILSVDEWCFDPHGQDFICQSSIDLRLRVKTHYFVDAFCPFAPYDTLQSQVILRDKLCKPHSPLTLGVSPADIILFIS